MVDVFDLQVRIGLVDQLAEGGAFFVERHVGDLGEGRLQTGQTLGGRLGTREFFVVQGNRAVEIIDGDQALIEPAFGYGDSGPALAFQSKRVDILAGDAFHRGDGVGADALVALGMDGAQVQIALVHARRADLGPTGGSWAV